MLLTRPPLSLTHSRRLSSTRTHTALVVHFRTPLLSLFPAAMLSLAKQHLQQRAQSQQQLQRSAQQQQQQQSQRVPSHKAALADFPLAAPTQAKGKGKKAGKAAAAALQKPAFAAKAARRAASSKAVLKRAKLLARKMPRPSLLERAERALADATPDATAITARNERILSHESDRKLKTQAAMKKVRGAGMLTHAHCDGVPPSPRALRSSFGCSLLSLAKCCVTAVTLSLSDSAGHDTAIATRREGGGRGGRG